MNIQVKSAMKTLAADGGADGYLDVADNSGFYVGCEAWLRSDTVGPQRCEIVELVSNDTVGVKFLREENSGYGYKPGSYGRSDCSAYKTANNAKLFMPAQIARVDAAFAKVQVP